MNFLGMFARLPEPGKTKTRLAASIGNTAAAELYAAFVEDLVGRCGKLADQFAIAVTPDTPDTFDWFEEFADYETDIIAQPDGDLGDKVSWFFDHACQQGSDRTVLIGSDSPDLPSEIITSAFERLEKFDVVISPATDGGYVLIGLRAAAGELFSGISWSSAATLTDTITKARSLELSVELLQPWYDIDTIQNLGTLIPLQQSRGAGNADCPRTEIALARLSAEIEIALAKG